MKTIKKKTPVLTFDKVFPDCDTAHTYEVSLGTQRLGHVSYEQAGGAVLITDLYVNPEFDSFGVELQILDALIASDEVFMISIVTPLSKASTYERAGFVCDPSSVLLHKKK